MVRSGDWGNPKRCEGGRRSPVGWARDESAGRSRWRTAVAVRAEESPDSTEQGGG